MPPGGEAARGRGGKFNKAKRGGGKHFSRNLTPLDADGNPVSMWADPRDLKRDGEASDEVSEEESSEEEEEEDEEESEDEAAQEEQSMTREQRRAAAKAKKEAAIAKKKQRAAEPGDLPPSSSEEEEEDRDMPANPNHTAKSKAQAAGSSKSDAKPELSRREREALQAQQARERYQKLHAEGKTEEARADLARLKLVREQREAAAARKQAEKEEREAAEERRLAEMDEKERKKRAAALGSAGRKPGSKKPTKA